MDAPDDMNGLWRQHEIDRVRKPPDERAVCLAVDEGIQLWRPANLGETRVHGTEVFEAQASGLRLVPYEGLAEIGLNERAEGEAPH